MLRDSHCVSKQVVAFMGSGSKSASCRHRGMSKNQQQEALERFKAAGEQDGARQGEARRESMGIRRRCRQLNSSRRRAWLQEQHPPGPQRSLHPSWKGCN